MISYLKGKVVRKTALGAIIERSGLGYLVLLPERTLAKIREDSEVEVFTAVIYRNDSFEIFGFEEYEELELFELLKRIDSVGPKLAFKIIGTLGIEGISQAIQKKNSVIFEKVPGIGRKTASKILLELVNKMEGFILTSRHAENDEVQVAKEALLQLGVSRDEITKIFAEIDFSGLKNASEIVREVLKLLGAKK
jgi:Holliday junction DNA helicase RuvA